MGKYKWEELGIPYPLEGIEPPKNDRVENAKNYYMSRTIKVI